MQQGRYHGGRRPSSDDSFHSPTVIPPSAETEALIQAAFIVQASDHDCKQVVFLSDALSVLQAYQNHKLPNLTKALQQVAATRRAVLQWIPAHCGILGNEQADILA